MKKVQKISVLILIMLLFLVIGVSYNIKLKSVTLGTNITKYGIGLASATEEDSIDGYVLRETLDYKYTGSVQKLYMGYDAYLILETWGASGGGTGLNGYGDSGNAGRGGYSYGELKVDRGTELFVYVGGHGLCSNSSRAVGGFNGGGYSWSSGDSEPACGGGGATDIRLYRDSLYNRVIVAGGGGGGGEDRADAVGAGGGTSGGNGGAAGGTQTGGGPGAVFGIGASTPNDGGGGGGGWYGGGTVNGSQTIPTGNSGNDSQGGAGGSGFVYGATTATYVPSNFALTSKDYLKNSFTKAGTTSFTSSTGTNETGHLGNGYARIKSYDKCNGSSALGYILVDGGTASEQKIIPDENAKVVDIYFDADKNNASFEMYALESCSTITGPLVNAKDVEIAPGVTSYNVIVVSSTGETTVHTIRLHREISANSKLPMLYINGEKLQGFSEDNGRYTINYEYDQFEIDITADKYNKNQTIKGLGHYELINNDTKINIVVTAENGVTEQVYELNIHRDESTYLKTLTSSRMRFVTSLMRGVYNYKILESSYLDNKYLTYAAADPDATVTINGDLKTDSSITLTVSKEGLSSTVYTITKSNNYGYSYTGTPQLFIAPYTAEYDLYVWGAQGGYRTDANYGGKGGFATGRLLLEKGDKLYVYVGSAGNNGGYNGGGVRQGFPNNRGGGATDMRLEVGNLYTRIIVAGGGGSDGDFNDGRNGGYGGGDSGQSKTESYGTGGVGGTQSSPGGNGASFGVGGPGLAQNNGYGGAGGGGWYGGGGVTPDGSADDDRGGGGGSGYVLTASSHKPSGYKVTEKYYLSNTTMFNGAQTMPTHDLQSTMTGNIGDGYALIVPYNILSDNNYLSALNINSGSNNYPINFNKDTLTYDIILNSEDSRVNITATPEDDSAMIIMDGDGIYDIPSGNYSYNIDVVAGNGEIKTYTINFTRAASSYKYLDDIKINGNSIAGFEKDKLNYVVRLPYYEVTNVSIEGIKARTDQRIIGNDTIQITEGTLSRLIQVYSEDGNYNTIYTITFIIDNSSRLKELSIGHMSLSPEFFRETFKYTIQLTENPRDAEYHIVPYDPDATYRIEGDLASGDNILKVIVSEPYSEDTIYEIKANGEYEFTHTGNYRVWTAPVSGIFDLEVWGAQGGYRTNSNMGGKGAYAKGRITVTQGTKLYIYVGGAGNNGGFNGGGERAGYTNNRGGGATDIRLEADDLYSRVIVAAGGGSDGATGKPGGAGGALNGQTRTESYGTGGAGASQTAGGANRGAFGIGGAGLAQSNGYGGAGGGGWYGGGGVTPDGSADDDRGGGGGSSFVFNDLNATLPEGYNILERYLLTNTNLIGGTASMPTHDGTGRMTGNSGNGFAKITLIEARSGDSTLASITTNKGTWDRPFDPTKKEVKDRTYTIYLDKDDFDVEINAVANATSSVISESIMHDNDTLINHEIPSEITVNADILANNDTREILITAEDGTTTIYTLKFVRGESSYKYLENILIDGVPIEGFASDKFNYNINLNFDVENEIELKAVYGRPSQVITGDGTIDVSSGKVTVSIEVISEDGSSVTTYNLTLNKTPSTKLKTIILQDELLALSPEFAPLTYEYDLTLPKNSLSLPLTAIPYDSGATVSVSGNGYVNKSKDVKITVSKKGLADTVYVIHITKTDLSNTEYNFDYTGDYQIFTAPEVGNYKLEVWGAQGGYRSSTAYGGKGGYATGTITLRKNEKIYVYVGGAGNNGGYNGGGVRPTNKTDVTLPGGGGATDMRGFQTIENVPENLNWNNNLDNRFLVAGGGGSDGSPNRNGGYGGGTNGETRTQSYGSGGNGGTQTAGGAGGRDYLKGTYGQGGNSLFYANGFGGAGGGGWYGGGGVYPDGSVDDDRGGGGGSGFALTETATVPSTYALDKLTKLNQDNVLVQDTKYYLTDTSLIAGNAQMPNPNGGYMTGRTGNGYARITYLKPLSENNFLAKLDVDKGKIKTDFDPENPVSDKVYVVNLEPHQTSIEIKGYVSDATASIVGNGVYDIPAGETPIELEVTAESGDVRIYTVKFVRAASDDNSVQNIEISGFVPSLCALNDEYCNYQYVFGINEYSITVPRRIKELQTIVTKGHKYQTIKYYKAEVDEKGDVVYDESGNPILTEIDSNIMNCTSEYTAYVVQIISEDGSKTDNMVTYKIHRDMVGNNDLQSIIMNSEDTNESGETVTINWLEGQFDPDITEYFATLPRKHDAFEMIVTPDDALATVTVTNDTTGDVISLTESTETDADGNTIKSYSFNVTDLPLGLTLYNVVVRATNGEERSYIVSVWHAKSDNAFLQNLEINDYTEGETTPEGNKILGDVINYTPNFQQTITDYSVTVPNDVKRVVITPTVADTNLSHTNVREYYDLNTGVNTIPITVTAEDGEANLTYNITINREKNSNANLALLRVLSNTHDDIAQETEYLKVEDFDNDTLTYYVDVPASTNSLYIDTIAAVPETSTVSVSGNNSIRTGQNTIKIKVTAEDKTTKTYTVIANRIPSDNNLLSNIEVKNGSTNISLNEAFDSALNNYTVLVENDVKTINVTGIKDDSRSTVTGNGQRQLVVGQNVIELIVTSESGIDNIYTLIVTRKPSSNAFLKEIRNDQNISLNEAITDDNFAYTLTVPKEVSEITITGIPKDNTATVTGGGTFSLNVGENEAIPLTITAEDGTVKNYTLTITRDLSVINTLESLTLEEAILNFNKNTLTYNVTVPNDITDVTLSYVATSKDVQSVTVIKEYGNDKTSTELVVGETNIVKVVVVPEKGEEYSKTYTINVTRLEPEPLSSYLSSLTTNRGELVPEFIKNKLYYTLTVANNIDTIKIDAVPEVETSTVVGAGVHNLYEGENLIAIQVTTTENNTRIYQVIITREYSNDATLANLEVEGIILSPSFAGDITEYNINTTKSTLQFINVETNHPDASYEIINNNLNIGENIVTVRVTAPDGKTTKDYNFNVNKEASRNNNLANLEIEDVPFTTPTTFNKGTTLYYANVSSDVNSINVIATPEDSSATVTGNGTVNLVSGENIIEVNVTSESGSTKIYTIVVTRLLDNNNYLSTLSIQNVQSGANLTLDQEFTKELQTYTLTVPYEVEEIEVTGTKESSNASVTGLTRYNLEVGSNTINVIVTAQTGDTRTYVITVTRERCISDKIISVNIPHYSLSPKFNKDNFNYVLDVDNEITNLEVITSGTPEILNNKLQMSVTLEDSNASIVSITGNDSFVVGQNTVTITVESSADSEGNKTTQAYTFTINRKPYSNNYLAFIGLSTGTLVPNFVKTTLDYTVDVPYNVDEITITSEPDVESSTIVTGNGTHPLQTGENKITIRVKSVLGVTRDYIVTVNKAKSPINTLSNLEVKKGNSNLTLTPEFSSNHYEYTIDDLDINVEKLNIIATPTSNKATVSGTGEVSVVGRKDNIIYKTVDGVSKKYNVYRFEVVVTAENDDTQTYTIIVNKELDSNTHLTDLTPSIGTLSPEFDYDTNEYTLNLSSNSSLLSFEASTESRYATVSGLGLEPVANGTNDREIVVTAEDGSTRTIIVHVVKAREDEARLQSLVVNGYNFTSEFNPDTYSYNIVVPYDKKILSPNDIEAIPVDSNATIYKQNALNLQTNKDNVYIIKVVAVDGFTEQIYTIHVERTLGDIATLSSISILGQSVTPSITDDNFTYSVKVPKNTTEINASDVVAVPTDSDATVTKLSYLSVTGNNEIYTITVESASGNTTNTYQISVSYMDDTNNKLASLTPHIGNSEGLTTGSFEEEFDPERLNYTLSLNSIQDRVSFSGVLDSAYSEIISGVDEVIMVNTLKKTHTIVVRAEDGSERTYTITINRSSGTDANLKSLSFGEYSLTRTFDSYTYEYTLLVPKGTTNIEKDIVSAIPSDKYATVSIPDNFLITDDNRDYEITVTSANGEVTENYVIHIDYIYSSDATLSELTSDFGEFDPTFDPNTTSYTLNVRDTQNSVIISAVPNNEFATIVSGTGNVSLDNEETAHEITVLAENGTTKIYTINIVKSITTELYLQNITINGMESENCNPLLHYCELSSAFKETTTDYSVTVPPDIEVLSMDVVKKNKYQVVTYTNALTNEEFSPEGFVLEYGRNTFDVTVTNGLGQSTTYRYTIVRKASDNANLTSITLSNPVPNPNINFDPDVIEYNVAIDNEWTAIDVSATTEDPDASYQVYGNNDLWVGNNDVIVEVTAKSGYIKQYIIHVYRNESDNNFLSSLTVSTGKFVELNPVFDEKTKSYTVSVGSSVTSATIEARPEVDKTIVEGVTKTGLVDMKSPWQVELQTGLNSFEIKTTPEKGEGTSYVVNIIREESNNVNLRNLVVHNGEMNPPFSMSSSSFTVYVGSDVNELDMQVIPEDDNATYKVNGNKNLVKGRNTISISVTSSNKRRTKTYIIYVEKEGSAVNTLEDILIDNNSINTFEGITFNELVNTYTINVPTDKSSINIEGVKKDNTEVITGNGTYALDYGNNQISLIVTAENGDVNTYVVNVIREYNNNLQSLVVDEGELSPGFRKDITNYTVNVERDIEFITVLGIKENRNATLTGNGRYPLELGANTIEIVVSSSETSSKKYTITVNRSYDDSNKLSHLSASEGVFTENFNSDILEYNLEVPYEVSNLSLNIIPLSEHATYEVSGNENFIVCEDDTYCNTVTVNVKSEKDTQNNLAGINYIIHVKKTEQESISSKLSSLSVVANGEELITNFVNTNYAYNVTVDTDTESATITAIPELEDSTVTNTGIKTLGYGDNIFQIVVTNNLGNTHTYTVNVYRELSDEARIKTLSFDGATLNEEFNPDVFNYTMNVSNDVTSLTENIELMATENLGIYSIVGNKNLEGGENIITIKSISPSRDVTLTYTITVTKGLSNAKKLLTFSIDNNVGTLDKEFNPDVNSYKISVPFGVNSLIFNGTISDKATVTGLGLRNILSNVQIMNVEVAAEDGTTNIYTFTIERELSDNNLLRLLSVNAGDFTESFEPNKLNYTLNVQATVENLVVNATPEDPLAIVSGAGLITLNSGVTTIPITVRAQNNEERTYTITVNKIKETSAKILSLNILNGTINPEFDKDDNNYLVDVPGDVSSLNMEIILEDNTASYTITGNEAFKTGNNLVTITVTNGELESVYTLRVNKQILSNNYLNTLYTDRGELIPEFDPSTLNYRMNVDSSIERITIFAEANDPMATIEGTGIYTLQSGTNKYPVVVTSATGVKRTYTITITRDASNDNKLLTLSTNIGNITPLFDPNSNIYTLNVPAETDEVVLSGDISNRASVTGLGKITLASGIQTHTITVTSESGIENIYTININRPLSSNATINNITPSIGSLSPNFSNDVKDYDIELIGDIPNISFTVDTNSPLATVEMEDSYDLDYGTKLITITVTAEDGVTTNKVNIRVNKIKDIIDIVVPEQINISPNGTYQLEVGYNPEDTTRTGVTYQVIGSNIITIDENGLITSDGTIGMTTLLVTSTKKPSIQKTIQVNVNVSEITSDSYEINRHVDISYEVDNATDVSYVTNIPLELTVQDFLNNFDNDISLLSIYDKNGNEITDMNTLVGTGMTVKLESNGTVYDELNVTVLGDINGDGICNIKDFTLMKQYLGYVLDANNKDFFAFDVTKDGIINIKDFTKIKQYLGYQFDSFF